MFKVIGYFLLVVLLLGCSDVVFQDLDYLNSELSTEAFEISTNIPFCRIVLDDDEYLLNLDIQDFHYYFSNLDYYYIDGGWIALLKSDRNVLTFNINKETDSIKFDIIYSSFLNEMRIQMELDGIEYNSVLNDPPALGLIKDKKIFDGGICYMDIFDERVRAVMEGTVYAFSREDYDESWHEERVEADDDDKSLVSSYYSGFAPTSSSSHSFRIEILSRVEVVENRKDWNLIMSALWKNDFSKTRFFLY